MDEMLEERHTDENHNKKDGRFSIDWYMLPAKVAFFFKGGRIAMDPYFILFFISLGLISGSATIIIGCMFMGGFVGSPFLGFIADKFKLHRVVVLVSCSIAGIALCAQPVFGMMFADKQTFKCPSNTTRTFVSPNNDKLFFSVLLVAFVQMWFDTGVISLIDAGCLNRVESTTGSDIGKQRYIGAIGTLIIDNCNGFIIMFYPKSNTSCETGIIVVYFLITVGLGVSSYFLFKGITMERRDEMTATGTNVLISVLRNFDNIFFLACVLVGGMMHAFYFSFCFLYLKDLKALPLIYGMSGTAMASVGGIVYFFS